jgi:hypothetical protein
LLKNGNLRKLSALSVFYATLVLILVVTTSFFLRPIQDDYLVLKNLTTGSVIEWVQSIWKFQGGNLFPYSANALLLSMSKSSPTFIGILLFYLSTLALVSFASVAVLLQITGFRIREVPRRFILIYILIALASFEGLFVPEFIGAFSFSLASFSHLWPISLFLLMLFFLERRPELWPISIPIGFIVGISNVVESFFAFVFACIFLIVILGNSKKYNIKQRIFSAALVINIFIGLLVTISAPGFSNRATTSVGFPETPSEFFWRLKLAALSFPLDLFSHPALYLAFVFGYFLGKTIWSNATFPSLSLKLKFLSGMSVSLLLLLIVGGTLAYTAWHQSFGLYQLFCPLFFGLGVHSSRFNLKVVERNFIWVTVLLLLLNIFSIFRAGYMIVERGVEWDKTFTANSCLVKQNDTEGLVGSELRYPPLGYGIQDIQKFQWLKDGYVGWLTHLNSINPPKC